MTLTWIMPASINPPLIAISISPTRYTHQLIQETGEFVINIPTIDIIDAVFFCGAVSGIKCDKFKETGLTPLQARKVKLPIIKECIAHLECKLKNQLTIGDHTVFIAEVVEAYADKNILADGRYNLEKTKMLYHLGVEEFTTIQSRIFRPSGVDSIYSKNV
jgi:flavin reductase (DIM6/NTAB) family NADH-FMN oxidoreductase RutF